MSGLPRSTVEQVAHEAACVFAARFGAAPRWLAAAPGRLNLIGEHTDYTGGFVLPMAIERWCVAAAAPARGERSVIRSRALDDEVEIDLSRPLTRSRRRARSTWVNYLLGVARGFQLRGLTLPNLDILIESTVPVGAGLSSSAALSVSFATMLEEALGVRIEGSEKAALCRSAERDFAGTPCGIMDQFICIHARPGCALHLDCLNETFEHVPLPPREEALVLVIDTRVEHELAAGRYRDTLRQCLTALEAVREITGGAFSASNIRDMDDAALRRCAECMSPNLFRPVRHIVSENRRVLEAVAALRAHEFERFGSLMYASHESLRDDYGVSCPELDAIVEAARAIGRAGGVFGARMTGAGFGGCAIVLCRPRAAEEASRRISAEFEARFAVSPMIFPTGAVAGAAPHLRKMGSGTISFEIRQVVEEQEPL